MTHILKLSDVQSTIFPGGEVHVQLTDEQLQCTELYAGIIKNSNTLMKFVLTLDALCYHRAGILEELLIHCPYLPYARQDRVCSKGQAYSLNIFLKLLDYAGCHFIFNDIHNPSTIFFNYTSFENLLPIFVQKEELSQYSAVIAPDKGAKERAIHQAQGVLPVIQAEKVRDPNTGWITDYEIDLSQVKGKVLVIDDICDGGKTFEILGERLKKENISADLYVTHGIFSKGKETLEKYYEKVSAIHDWTIEEN
jgi:ribose-phosphate pyrophosphokinase